MYYNLFELLFNEYIFNKGGGLLTRKEQKEQRIQQILSVALDLFIKKGFVATQIADIAKAANMSLGLLFHYFESKESLYVALVKIGLQGTQTPFKTEFGEPIAFFTEFVESLFQYANEQPMTAKMFTFMRQAQKRDDVPELANEIAMQVNAIEESIAIIEAGQRQGTIKAGNPAALSNAFWCSVQGIMEQYAQDSSVPLPEADWIVDIIRNTTKNVLEENL